MCENSHIHYEREDFYILFIQNATDLVKSRTTEGTESAQVLK